MIPANHAHIEEILNWHPDGVIAGQYGAPGLKTLLPRFNIPLREVPYRKTSPALYANWRLLAGWTHREPAAEALIDTLEAGFQTLARDLTPSRFEPSSSIPMVGSLEQVIFRMPTPAKLGLINLAKDRVSPAGEG